MKSTFKEPLSKRSDEELLNILSSNPGSYQIDIIEEAIKEAKKRNLEYDDDNANMRLLNEKYPRLRFISNVFKFSAYVLMIIVISYFIGSLIDDRLNLELGIKRLIFGAILYLSFLATSEVIKVIIDIEYNTRITAQHIKKKEIK